MHLGETVNNPLEEILDVKDLQINGEMMMSETIGKPKDIYETIENISQSNLNNFPNIIF